MTDHATLAPAAARLMALIERLKAPYGHERSVKLSARRLDDQRFLLSLHKSALGTDHAAQLLGICDALGLPAGHRRDVAAYAVDADIVHFGFEQGRDGPLYKVYLEYAARLRRALADPRPAPAELLVHRAVKWAARDPGRCVVTTYTCHPGLDAVGIADKLAALFGGDRDAMPHRAARVLLDRALSKTSEDELFYLSVKEAGSRRDSYDIRLYGAELSIMDVSDVILDISRHYFISATRAAQFVESDGAETLGHISGGLDREGKSFVTFYFGVMSR